MTELVSILTALTTIVLAGAVIVAITQLRARRTSHSMARRATDPTDAMTIG